MNINYYYKVRLDKRFSPFLNIQRKAKCSYISYLTNCSEQVIRGWDAFLYEKLLALYIQDVVLCYFPFSSIVLGITFNIREQSLFFIFACCKFCFLFEQKRKKNIAFTFELFIHSNHQFHRERFRCMFVLSKALQHPQGNLREPIKYICAWLASTAELI